MTQNHDLGAMVGCTPAPLPPSPGLGTCWDSCLLGARTHPMASTLVPRARGSHRDRMGQLPGARSMGRC